jgi:hypothetical protein
MFDTYLYSAARARCWRMFFFEEGRENGLALPPFVFFGDRELLAQIQEALQ